MSPKPHNPLVILYLNINPPKRIILIPQSPHIILSYFPDVIYIFFSMPHIYHMFWTHELSPLSLPKRNPREVRKKGKNNDTHKVIIQFSPHRSCHIIPHLMSPHIIFFKHFTPTTPSYGSGRDRPKGGVNRIKNSVWSLMGSLLIPHPTKALVTIFLFNLVLLLLSPKFFSLFWLFFRAI